MTPTPKVKIVRLNTSEIRLLIAALDNHKQTLEIELDVMRCNEIAENLRKAIRRRETAREILERWEKEDATS